MWVVRLAHSSVNKFRVIAADTREAAELEAANQIKAWDGEFGSTIVTAAAVARGERRWLNPKEMKDLLSSDQRQRQLAEHLNAQVERELASLNSVLQLGTLARVKVNWWATPEPFRPASEPIPAEPNPKSYAAHVGLVRGLIPSIRRRELSAAEERFEAAHLEWEAQKSTIEERNREREEMFLREHATWRAKQKELADSWMRHDPKVVEAYCSAILRVSRYPYFVASVPSIATFLPFSNSVAATEHPDSFPRTFEVEYNPTNRTAVLDYELPAKEALPSAKGYRRVAAGDRVVPIPLSQSAIDETYDCVLYQVALRTTYELLRWDGANGIDSVVFNGWVAATDTATGHRVHPCILSVQSTKKEFLEINFAEVDPKACFRKLKGISGARLAAMSPVRPILQLNREDERFISARPVMDVVDGSTNLAAMNWEDFEQLIRDVFEKEFSGGGGEVKITRASRDHGVDAVAFDPDPIRGGKIVIQAKRYTDTVSVSAVRDLYGTILNEGANKGILVTTADYGPDAYEFAKGKPITLLSGSELLYLLQKHGHKARIDIAEARILSSEREA
jgi:restriction system protein